MDRPGSLTEVDSRNSRRGRHCAPLLIVRQSPDNRPQQDTLARSGGSCEEDTLAPTDVFEHDELLVRQPRLVWRSVDVNVLERPKG